MTPQSSLLEKNAVAALVRNLTTRYMRALDWLAALRRGSPRGAGVQQQQGSEIHLAFHQAYRRFAQTHPDWVRRRFDDDFLRQTVIPRLKRHQPASALPTGMALALCWDSRFGALAADAVRAQRLAELTTAANHFLHLLELALQPEA